MRRLVASMWRPGSAGEQDDDVPYVAGRDVIPRDLPYVLGGDRERRGVDVPMRVADDVPRDDDEPGGVIYVIEGADTPADRVRLLLDQAAREMESVLDHRLSWRDRLAAAAALGSVRRAADEFDDAMQRWQDDA